jgi:hypothetical protein
LSLLLQIPFFIAAYKYLDGLEALKGVSFLFINDLSQPDDLLGSIHLLPILMTVINLITAWFYTRNGNMGERKQMLVVAAIFLVLLFNLPSGLVLYWTMNNVFSFFRLFITNPEVFKRFKRSENIGAKYNVKDSLQVLLPKLKSTFYFLTVLLILGQLNWAFQHSFEDIFVRILGAILGGFLLTGFLGFLILIHQLRNASQVFITKQTFYFYWAVFRKLFFTIWVLAILSQINWALHFNFNSITQRLILASLASALLTFVLGFIIVVYQQKVSWITSIKKFLHTKWTKAFRVFFGILLITAIFSQINWALQFNFDDIILRLTLAVLGSWFIVSLVFFSINFARSIPNEKLNILKNQIVAAKKKTFLIFTFIAVLAVVLQINWAIQHNFDDIILRLALATLGSFVIWELWILALLNKKSLQKVTIHPSVLTGFIFAILYFQLASLFYYEQPNLVLNRISIILLVLIQPLAITHFINVNRNKTKLKVKLRILGIVLLIQFLYLVEYSIPDAHLLNFLGEKKLFDLTMFVFVGLLSLLLIRTFSYSKTKLNYVRSSFWIIYILAIFYIAGFVFLWNPLITFSTYAAAFGFSAIDITVTNLPWFLLSFGSLTLVFLLIPKSRKEIWLRVVLVLSVVGLINSTFFPIDLGTLQEGKFILQEKLAQPIIFYVIESIVIIILSLFFKWLLRHKKFQSIIIFLLVINIVLMAQSIVESYQTGSFFEVKNPDPDSSSAVSFSKDKENTVFILADMMHGVYLKKILQENTEIGESLNGFTWYPNTLSGSCITCPSIAGLLGGYDYTPDNLNKDPRPIGEKITEISAEFINKIKSQGMNFIGNQIIYSTLDKSTYDVYLPKWHDDWDKWNSRLNIGVSKETGYKILWQNALLYSSPLVFKPGIYNNGNWLNMTVESNENNARVYSYNFLRLLPFISDTKGEKPNFIYIHSYAAHQPWDIVDDNGRLNEDVDTYDNNKWTIEAIINWFEWMKRNNVYDNSRIVILSDHGPHLPRCSENCNDSLFFTYNSSINAKQSKMEALFPILLVKEINATGRLKTDTRLMTNMDARYILFNENDPTKANPHRKRKLFATYVTWIKRIWEVEDYLIEYRFEVTDSVYNFNNWRRMDEEITSYQEILN